MRQEYAIPFATPLDRPQHANNPQIQGDDPRLWHPLGSARLVLREDDQALIEVNVLPAKRRRFAGRQPVNQRKTSTFLNREPGVGRFRPLLRVARMMEWNSAGVMSRRGSPTRCVTPRNGFDVMTRFYQPVWR